MISTYILSFAGVMKTIGGVLLAVVVLLAMVTIHEFGHYVAGKALGFKINEFAVGFGPAILKKRSRKTGELFALRIIPLGGYCAFDGEDDMEDETSDGLKQEGASEENSATEDDEPFREIREETETDEVASNVQKTENEGGMVELNEENSPISQTEKQTEKQEKEDTEDGYPEPQGVRFNDQPPWKRIIVLIAGATMNYLLALVLLLIMVGVYGQPMCIVLPIGYTSEMEVPHAEWDDPTLCARDILLEINGEKISMITDCIDGLKGKKAGDDVSVKVLRRAEEGWKEKTVTLTLQADADFENMADVELMNQVMGLETYTTTLKRGGWHTVSGAFRYSAEMGTSVIRTLGELLTGKLGIDAVGGPITTITTTAQVATNSFFSFLYISSFIGVNLAVFNLLPIPALDGCKVIFCIIEWIRKKPVNRKVETIIHFVGIIALFAFAILVDVFQLFHRIF
ncbi:MAG: site-2 protease family protein [Clostridia bacterium]|nr:site-2 protease family protein [Clostridia bacterium]